MTNEEVVEKFEKLSPEDQQAMLAALPDAVQEFNLKIQRLYHEAQDEVLGLQRVIYALRPVVPAAKKGRVRCIVCHAEGKQREFKHLTRCPWENLNKAVAEAQRAAREGLA